MASPADPRKPPFPKPFVDYVMEYHKSHTNSLRFACIVSRRDISPFAAQLAPYFQHVHVHLVQEEDSFGGKEVQQTDLKSVREALTAHHDEHWEQARFTISAGLTTALYSAIPSRSVDMMFFDDWHWDEEGNPFTTLAYELSTPNGCLVYSAFNTLPTIRIRGRGLTEEQSASHQSLLDEVKRQLQYGAAAKRLSRQDPLRVLMQRVNSGLDYVDLDPSKVYENVTKRIGINCSAIGAQAFESYVFDRDLAQRITYTQKPQERLVDRQEDVTAQSASFTQKVDCEWWSQYLRYELDVEHELNPGLLPRLYDMFKDVKEMELVWSAQLLLATRNMQKLNW